LLHGIRTVAIGASLLDPEVTRTLVGRYASRIRPAERNPLPENRLSPREIEVLRPIADGRSNSEIAAMLTISPETVKTFVSRTLRKLDLRDRVEAVVYAYRDGLVTQTWLIKANSRPSARSRALRIGRPGLP
jgi:DNA-binding NarL/FixJ family response regulator